MTQGTEDRRRRPRRRSARRRGERRGIVASLVVSGLAHLLFVVLYPFFAVPAPGGVTFPLQQPSDSEPAGIQVVQIVEVVAPEADDPADPVEIETPDDPGMEPESPDFEEDLSVRFHRYLTAAERLQPGRGDPRLWVPMDPALAAPTGEHLLETRLALAIRSSNDSLAAALEEARAATDWTHTDEEGKRWGVSPGRIHLGDLTIPLPFGFGRPYDYNGDRAEMGARIADINRAAGAVAARQSWKERREVMKKRREELRALKQQGKGQGSDAKKAVVKPDTTTSRPGRR